MVSLLALLPDILHWLPIAAGGGGLAASAAAFLPSLQKYALIALGVLLALSVIGLLWYRGEYEACSGGQARAIADAQKKADDLANELIIAQAAAMAATEKTVTVFRDRIVNAPTTNTCGPTVRDAARGVRSLLGEPDAQRGAPAAVR